MVCPREIDRAIKTFRVTTLNFSWKIPKIAIFQIRDMFQSIIVAIYVTFRECNICKMMSTERKLVPWKGSTFWKPSCSSFMCNFGTRHYGMYVVIISIWVLLPSRELTYLTRGKGQIIFKSPWEGGYVSSQFPGGSFDVVCICLSACWTWRYDLEYLFRYFSVCSFIILTKPFQNGPYWLSVVAQQRKTGQFFVYLQKMSQIPHTIHVWYFLPGFTIKSSQM